jgi:hypothetical protein
VTTLICLTIAAYLPKTVLKISVLASFSVFVFACVLFVRHGTGFDGTIKSSHLSVPVRLLSSKAIIRNWTITFPVFPKN